MPGFRGGAFISAGLDLAEEYAPKAIIAEGLRDAIDAMEGMVGNEGQYVTFENHIVPAFREQTGEILDAEYLEDSWDPIDIGEPYMSFVGEIIEEGNMIMESALGEAVALEEEIEEAEAFLFIASQGRIGSLWDIVRDFFD